MSPQFEMTLWMTKGPKGSHDCEGPLTTLDKALFAKCDDRNYRVRQEIYKRLQFGDQIRLQLTAYQVAHFFIQRRLDNTGGRLKWDDAVELPSQPQPPLMDLTAFSGGSDAGT